MLIGGHDGCRGSACAKTVYCAIVCIAKKKKKKNELVDPTSFLPPKVVPGDELGKWTGFKKVRVPIA
jgi:hypothetical protein